MEITPENWSYSCYKSLKLLAFVSYGAEPDEDQATNIRELYFVTVTDLDHQEVFQESFDSLEHAMGQLNSKYGHWEYSASLRPSSGGCGTCSAH